jgi:hypothetical protein
MIGQIRWGPKDLVDLPGPLVIRRGWAKIGQLARRAVTLHAPRLREEPVRARGHAQLLQNASTALGFNTRRKQPATP